MTRKPICVGPTETVTAARKIMHEAGIRHLPVVEDGRLIGILSLRDLYRGAAQQIALTGELMTKPAIEIALHETLLAAAALLSKHQISALPVVDQGALVGILTTTDLLEPIGALLAADKRPRDGFVPVASLMTSRPLVLAEPTDTIRDARERMVSHRVRHLPVVADHVLVGMISERDLLGVNEDVSGPLMVGDIMSRHPVYVHPDDAAADVCALLARRRFGALPVLDRHKLVGMLTVADCLYYLLSLGDA